jgi:hypothetical protein
MKSHIVLRLEDFSEIAEWKAEQRRKDAEDIAEEMNLPTRAPELFQLLQDSIRAHVRRIQSTQMASSRADTDDQSNQDENRSIGCRWGSGRLTVVVDWLDLEDRRKSFAAR